MQEPSFSVLSTFIIVVYSIIMAYDVNFFALFLILFSFSEFDPAQGDITTTQFLRDPETLKSNNAIFMCGFFSPMNSTNRYVGIWYNKEVGDKLEVIWVANRDNPLNDSSGVLIISEDGNLLLLDGQKKSIWSSNITAKIEVNTSVAQLLDTGNLVLFVANGNIIWQSFDHPTNSLLPHMKLTVDENTNTRSVLSSWKSASDPSKGRFTAGLIHRNLSEAFIWDGDRPYWRSGPWEGRGFMGIRAMYYFVKEDGVCLENDSIGTSSLSFSSFSKRGT